MEPKSTTDEPLSNFEKWRDFTNGLISPDSYINFGWFYLVSAALQRRVFCGAKHKPIFPNPYTIFVGDPGIGKGLVITEVAKMLKYHKLSDPSERTTVVTGNNIGQIVNVDRATIEACAQADFYAANGDNERGPVAGKRYQATEKPLLLPVAADATSYEALVMAMSRSLRMKNYNEYDEKLGRNITKIYTHSSLCFCLEEISSLFRSKSHDVANFLLTAYDCGDYKKDTKTQGTDRIQKCCLSFLGGTTPTFMRRTFNDGLLNEGFASRGWFIFEAKNRKTAMFIPELNDNQKQHEQDLLAHIKKLADLYGQVTYTPEAAIFLDGWWQKAQTERPNISEKLLHYYARKQLHVQKLAMALHFSESLEMVIGIEECQRAIIMLSKVEKTMHHALVSKADNPYYNIGMKVIKYLEDSLEAKTMKELLARFWEDLPGPDPKESMYKTVEHYIITGKIVCLTGVSSRYTVIREADVIEDRPEALFIEDTKPTEEVNIVVEPTPTIV